MMFRRSTTMLSYCICVLMILTCANAQAQTAPLDYVDKLWMCALDLETGQSQRLFVMDYLEKAGSPSLSPDGTRLVFDGAYPGESASVVSRIFNCKLDGSDLNDLGPGAMPSWSPRGSRLAFSKYSPEQGVWIMSADGQNQRLIDQEGWSAIWSPNGRMIAYSRRVDSRPDFVIFNLVEDEFTFVFGDVASGYSSFYWNFAWSPDSQRICFKGTGDGLGSHIGSVSVGNEPTVAVHYRIKSFSADFTWLSNSQIVTSIYSPAEQCNRLVSVSAEPDVVDGVQEPIEIAGQFPERNNGEADLSRDGKTLLYVSKPKKK